VAFSAGALFGDAFLHLLPEAMDMCGGQNILVVCSYLILGFLVLRL
jgi:hypothetical protein